MIKGWRVLCFVRIRIREQRSKGRSRRHIIGGRWWLIRHLGHNLSGLDANRCANGLWHILRSSLNRMLGQNLVDHKTLSG